MIPNFAPRQTMASEPSIMLSIEDHGERGRVVRIFINHPSRLNILNSKLIAHLTSTLNNLRDDEGLRALVLTGAGGRAFIGGADINEMVSLDENSARAFITRLHQACAALRKLPVPVIARISGYCLGAGLEVAASCDMRVATEQSRFGMPEVRVGIPSVIEAALLPRLVGWGMAARLIYTGEVITAREAFDCGLIERVVAEEEIDRAVDDWIEAMLEAGPRAIRLQKALLQEWEKLSLDEAIERGIDSFAEAYRSDEPRTMMQRFLQRKRGQ
jgi:enoyl-CoA hydratase/carnithine racemase